MSEVIIFIKSLVVFKICKLINLELEGIEKGLERDRVLEKQIGYLEEIEKFYLFISLSTILLPARVIYTKLAMSFSSLVFKLHS